MARPIWLSVCLALALAFPVSAEQVVTELLLRVQVQGAVKRPGVYRLQGGSRVAELLARAGGPRRDAQLRGLNLTRRLADGDLVYVPTLQEARPQAPVARAARPKAKARRARARAKVAAARQLGPLNLNTATLAQLDTLPGVGPGLAAAILRERSRKGRFTSIEDLREVDGIGRKRFERLRRHVQVH